MIIGSIVEYGGSQAGTQSSVHNGGAMMHFYSMEDAVTWASLQSERITYGTASTIMDTVCIVVNTDTNEKRWWYSGIEYTG